MVKQLDLNDLFTKEHFRTVERIFNRNFGLELETTDIHGKTDGDKCSKCYECDFCKIIRKSATGKRRCKQDKLRALNISIETGQPYIFICHAGLVNVCVPIMERDVPLGGLFFGQCLWDKPDEGIEEDVLKRTRGLRIDRKGLIENLYSLRYLPGRKIHEASEFLYILLYQTAGLDPQVVQWRRMVSQQQSEISEFIQEYKKNGKAVVYPYENEQALIGKVKIGDQTGAKKILNSLLSNILVRNPGDINTLKARLVELLSILSRAAAEGGVDIDALLEKNLQYINTALAINSQEDLCGWISEALNDFIDQVYEAQDSGKISQIKPAIDFIEANYDKPITLSEISKAAFLSVSRLSHLFKEQMGITLIDYVTNVRINHSKELLLSTDKSCTNICFEVGYNNQSYFTRTFKQIVGLTPRQFRDHNARPVNTKKLL
jgi:two-component system response regulator YesN